MDTTLLEQEGMYEMWPGPKRIIKDGAMKRTLEANIAPLA